MHTIARLHITVSLVSVPVRVHSATEPRPLPLHWAHTCGSRVRIRRYCETEGTEVPYEEIRHGYTTDDGATVVLTDAELADLPLPASRAIDIQGFLPADQIDPLQLAGSRAFYLSPDGPAATRPYLLLRDAISRRRQVAVARTTLRTRETLSVLSARSDVLTLQTMLWPDELRPPQDLAPASAPPPADELDLARTLLDTIGRVDLKAQHDAYRHALEQVVRAKIDGSEPAHAPAAPAAPVDLMAELQRSVDAARSRREHPERTQHA